MPLLCWKHRKGRAELIFWSDAYSKCSEYLQTDNVIICKGKPQSDGENLKIVVDEVWPVDEYVASVAKGYNIWVDLGSANTDTIRNFQNICTSEDNRARIVFQVFDRSIQYKQDYECNDINLDFTHKTINKVASIFGKENVRLLLR